MALTSAQLTAAFTNMSFGVAPTPLEQALINSYASQTGLSGGLSDEQALLNTAQLVGDTTAVAGLTYQFFTGSIPSEAGFYYLVNSEGNGDLTPNANDLNDDYYNTFNQENRYYNFAINLGTGDTASADDFEATYGDLTMEEAIFVAYEEIVGSGAAVDAGIDPDAARADILGRAAFFRQVAIERGNLADTPANAEAIDLAAKAVMVGYLLNEAFKASVGNLVGAFERFLLDVADGGADGTPPVYNVDVVEAYPGVDDAMEFTLTTGADAGSAFTGGSGDDTFFATEDTLTSTDILNGGAGDDTLILATSGAGPVTLAGFDTSSIEEFQVTSDATFGTTVDVSGAEDLQRIINTNSSRSLTLTGMVPTIDVTFADTTQGPTLPVDLTIQYVAAATAGEGTRQQITLANVIDPVDPTDGQTSINLTGNADGVEAVDLIVVGDNVITDLNSNGLNEVAVTGADNTTLTMEGVGFDEERPGQDTALFNAAAFQGDLDLTVDIAGPDALNIEVLGGSGDDRVDFTDGFTDEDSFDGGLGDDLLEINVNDLERTIADGADTDALNAADGEATGVETVSFVEGTFNDTVNLANLGAALTTLNIFTNIAGDPTLANLLSTTEVVIDDEEATTTGNVLTVDFVGDGAADAFNLTVMNIGAAGNASLVIADDNLLLPLDDASMDVFNLTAMDEDGGSTDELVLELRGLNELTTWNIEGDADIDASSTGTGDLSALATVNGALASGDIDLNDVYFTLGATGATITITTGSGDDLVGAVDFADAQTTPFDEEAASSLDGDDVISTGAGDDVVVAGLGDDTVTLGDGDDVGFGLQGSDVINGGAGDDIIAGGFGLDTLTGGTGIDRFYYGAIQDSQGDTVDVITDFVSGTDWIDLVDAISAVNSNVLFSSDIVFVGNTTSFGTGVTALTGSNGAEAFFAIDENTLYVDANGDGEIDTDADMAIILQGVTSITAEDIRATFLPVTFTSFAPNFNTGDPATSQEGSITLGGEADVINTTFDNLSGSTISGASSGTDAEEDVLNITDVIDAPVTLDNGTTGGAIDGTIERINLRQGSTALVTGPGGLEHEGMIISFGASTIFQTGGDDQTINGSNQADTVTISHDELDVNLRGGNDTANVNAVLTDTSIDGGAGADALNLAVGSGVHGDASVDLFETVNFLGNVTLSGDVNEDIRTSATTITGAGVTVTITNSTVPVTGIATAVAGTYVLADDPFQAGLQGHTFTPANGAQNVTSTAGGVDNITTALGALNGTYNLGSEDTLTLTSGGTVNLSGGTWSGGATVSLLNGSDVLMTEDDAAFQAFVGESGWTNSITLTGTGIVNNTVSLGTLTSIESVDATGLDNYDDLTLNATTAVTVSLGDADLLAGSSTGNITVSATGFAAATAAYISTGTGADTVTVTGDASWSIQAGGGADTVNMGAFLGNNEIVVDGGAGIDELTYLDDAAVTNQLDDVQGFETIRFTNAAVAVTETIADNSLFTGTANNAVTLVSNGSALVTLDLAAVTTGVLNTTVNQADSLITFTENNLVDTHTAGAGDNDYVLGSMNTVTNLANADILVGFALAGTDTIDVGGVVSGSTWTVDVSGVNLASFVGAVNNALDNIVNYGTNFADGDAIVVNVTGSGGLNGQYFIYDTTAGAGIDQTALVVELVGAGVVDTTNFVP